jgi:hypothetical protein
MKEEAKVQIKQYGETKTELGKISSVYDTREFCDHLIWAVNIAMTYCEDINQWSEEQKVSSIIFNE